MTAVEALRGVLEGHAAAMPDAVALHGGDADDRTRLTWRELRDAVVAVAAGAPQAGGPGPVVVVVDNSMDSVVVALGCLLADVDVLFAEPATAVTAATHPALAGGGGPALLAAAACGELAAAGGRRSPRVAAGRGDPAVLLLTSGSTGEPRITRQTLRDLLRAGAIHRDLYRLGPADTVLATVPLAHSFGLMVGLAGALVSGAGLAALAQVRPRALAERLAGVSVLLGAPLTYSLLALLPPADGAARRPGPRLALSAGAPLSADTADLAAAMLGCPVFQNYGSAETGPIASQHVRGAAWPADTVGVAVPGVDWRLEPSAGAPAGAGRLLVRTGTLFRGYLGEPSGGPRRDGFYDTGDLVRVDDAGHFFLEGRVSNFINVAGRKVNPRTVERVVEQYPPVREAAVYGVRAGENGEEVHAAVVLTAGGNAEDLVRHCRDRLAPYEVPHQVHVLSRLPRTARGKVARAQLPAYRP